MLAHAPLYAASERLCQIGVVQRYDETRHAHGSTRKQRDLQQQPLALIQKV